MKKTVFLAFLFISGAVYTTSAQTPTSYKKQPTVSVNFMLNDYNTAQSIRNSSVSEVLREDQWTKFTEMSPGLNISYFNGISNHVDFMASFGGSYTKYDFKNKPGAVSRSERLLLEADANVNLKLLTDNYKVNPYVTAGVGVSRFGSHYGAYIPVGLGIQFKLGDDAFIYTNAQYRVGITEFTNNHLNYSIGFGAPLKLSSKSE